MPPRLSTTVDDSLNPAEASMGQTSNGSNKRPRDEDEELDDDDDEEGGKKERTWSPYPSSILIILGRKIEIAFIKDKSRRHITFSKRKAGIMKKVDPL